MKVLLVSEGKHESSGALEALIDRIAGRPLDYLKHSANDAKIHRSHGVPGIGSRLSKRVHAFANLARQEACDAMVYLIDRDRDPYRQRALDQAQVDVRIAIAKAIGVAIETFDAWILADEIALSAVLGRAVQRQPDPETIHNAKDLCQNLLTSSPTPLRQREMYAEVCRRADLLALSTRCPNGFAPFSERVQRLFNVSG